MALKDNLISHWKLEEDGTATRADSHGSNDCPVTSGTVGSAAGKVGTAAYFDGHTIDRMRIDAPPVELVGGANAKIAGCAWINVDSVFANRIIVGNWVSVTGYRSWLFYVTVSRELALYVRNLAGTGYGLVVSTALLTLGAWHFVGFWYDGANLGVRVDTTEKTAAYSGDILDPSGIGADFAIGSYFATGQSPMVGFIDEVSFWRKVVAGTERIVTSAQMDEIYNSGNGLAFDLWDVGGGGRVISRDAIHGKVLV